MTVFSLREVSLVPARLDRVSLEIEGGITAVLGPSGAGKTSLLNVLAGFQDPDSGKITRPESVFWAPQDGGLWPGLTVEEHFAAMTRDKREIAGMVEAFDLENCARRPPEKLSRGQQARLTVARALLSAAPALVMDEPLAHVDPARRDRFWAVLRESITRKGQSLVFATHEPGSALAEADHAVCLKLGRLAARGRVSDLYWRPDSLEEAQFLGPANWFEQGESARWLGGEPPDGLRCLRPEQLVVTSAGEANPGPARATVISARFYGSHETLTLRHAETGEIKTFWHRPSHPRLRAEMPVLPRMADGSHPA